VVEEYNTDIISGEYPLDVVNGERSPSHPIVAEFAVAVEDAKIRIFLEDVAD
jgi:hypothetical protein